MKRFFRWVPKVHAETAKKTGLISHNGSALWLFDLTKDYRPGRAMSDNGILLAYELDETATANIERQTIDFESEYFKGEGKHPEHNIVKKNEVGAYGIGRRRQAPTNLHTKTKYATKKEVASALGLSVLEVNKKYEPDGGWP